MTVFCSVSLAVASQLTCPLHSGRDVPDIFMAANSLSFPYREVPQVPEGKYMRTF